MIYLCLKEIWACTANIDIAIIFTVYSNAWLMLHNFIRNKKLFDILTLQSFAPEYCNIDLVEEWMDMGSRKGSFPQNNHYHSFIHYTVLSAQKSKIHQFLTPHKLITITNSFLYRHHFTNFSVWKFPALFQIYLTTKSSSIDDAIFDFLIVFNSSLDPRWLQIRANMNAIRMFVVN